MCVCVCVYKFVTTGKHVANIFNSHNAHNERKEEKTSIYNNFSTKYKQHFTLIKLFEIR